MDCFSNSRELMTASRMASTNDSSVLSRYASLALLRGGEEGEEGRGKEGEEGRGEEGEEGEGEEGEDVGC